jgi:hypothetical protein
MTFITFPFSSKITTHTGIYPSSSKKYWWIIL